MDYLGTANAAVRTTVTEVKSSLVINHEILRFLLE